MEQKRQRTRETTYRNITKAREIIRISEKEILAKEERKSRENSKQQLLKT
jgi:hypothetical protein